MLQITVFIKCEIQVVDHVLALESFKSICIDKYLAEHQFYLIGKLLIAHGGWIGSSFASVLSLGTTRRNDPSSFTLKSIIFSFPPSLCSIYDGYSLYRYLILLLPSCAVLLVSWDFKNSPDETAYFRMLLNRVNNSNAAVIIQPALISYSFKLWYKFLHNYYEFHTMIPKR